MTLFEQHVSKIPARIFQSFFLSGHPQIAANNYDHTPLEELEGMKKFVSYRDPAREEFGFAILTDAAVERLRPYGPFLEVGAGTGYWAYELRKAGIDVVATDKAALSTNTYEFKKEWVKVEVLDAMKAVEKYPSRSLLIVWPSFSEEWAHKALCAHQGKTVVYVGEGRGGCTADEEFHRELAKHWIEVEEIGIPQWSGLHDVVWIYQRRNGAE